MNRTARSHAVVLGVLLTAILAGTVAFHVSSSGIARELRLTQGHTTSVSVFRLFPETLRMELQFRRDPARKPPAAHPLRWHPHPDAPVTLGARLGDRRAAYAAYPASAFGYDAMSRHLFPVPGGAPPGTPWPPRLELALALPSGFSTVDLEVTRVAPALEGETAVLTILPPVGFKVVSTHPGYQVLWWFRLWPVFLGGTAVYAVGVAWSRRRKQRHAARAA